jgi:hypothetical protein
MAATSSRQQVEKLLGTGKFTALTQTGIYEGGRVVARSEAPNVPVFPAMIEGKIREKFQISAFDYWYSLIALDKWLALPPGASPRTLEVYRQAFNSMVLDPEFLNAARKLSEDFEAQTGGDVTKLISALANTPPEALEFITGMMRRQGVAVQ